MQIRARLVRDGFWKNELLAECKPLTRLLFIGLWCLADREGRLEDRPARIKAEIFPYDNTDIEALLGELVARSFVVRYEASGQRYMAIPKFKDHQWVHPHEKASLIPAWSGQLEEAQPAPAAPREARAKRTAFEAETAPLPPELNSEAFRQVWLLWCRYRAEKRSRLTESTVDAQLKKLARWGEARAILALENSRTNGWTGIFEPKENTNEQRSGGNVGQGSRVRAPAGKYDGIGSTAQPFAPEAGPGGEAAADHPAEGVPPN